MMCVYIYIYLFKFPFPKVCTFGKISPKMPCVAIICQFYFLKVQISFIESFCT